jgi:polyhydroxybutyrate depolymerase
MCVRRLSRCASSLLAWAVPAAGALTLSCGSSSSGAPATGSTEGGAPTYDTNAPSAACGASNTAPGTTTVQLMSGGIARNYILHVPPGYAGKPTPLVINMHGFLSSASQQETWTEMNGVADSENFIVAYPNGAGTPSSWNAGSCCEYSDTSRDDVAFISAVIDDIAQSTCLALDRVYATGMSNGGFMSHNLGCNLSDKIAAIGPVSGVLGIAPVDCMPGRPIPVMEFHGTADPLVPYDGGTPSPALWSLLYSNAPPEFASVADTIGFWTIKDGCGATPQQTYSSGNATCETYSGCQGGAVVTLCTIDGGGHTWPGGNPSALPSFATNLVGPMTQSISASSQLWTFFKGYKLPVGFDGSMTAVPPYMNYPNASVATSDAGDAGTTSGGASDGAPGDATLE